jgi:3-dehydroquinate synthase
MFAGYNQYLHLEAMIHSLDPSSIFVIADINSAQHIPKIILDQTGIRWTQHIIPSGETSKSIAQAAECWEWLINFGADRKSLLIGVGGGVVTDLTGYVAANYMRGINYINCPTTLLGMVDAAIGGKTGINLPQGKNLIGSFHFPKGVISSLETLETLPQREFNAGMAEVIKTAYVADLGLFSAIELETISLEQIILRCQKIKMDIVEKDPYDQLSIRKALNFGHTIGHAIESASNYRYLHGEAVAIGMVMELELEAELGFTYATIGREPEESDHKRITSLLQKYNLPTDAPEFTLTELLPYIKRDKKSMYAINRP